MNNTFNINRFGKVLMADCRKYYRNFGITLAILCGLTFVMWLLTLIFNFNMPTIARWALIYTAVFLACIMVPAKAFGDINLQREGVRFAMLPASNLEKFLSYVLFCLLTPIVVLFLSWGVDSLLTALPFGGFVHYIKSFGIFDALENFVLEMDYADADMSDEGYLFFKDFANDFGPRYRINALIGFVFNVGLFMFGNLLFKTHKTAKTIACMIGLSYVISMITQLFLVSRNIYPWLQQHAEHLEISDVTNFATSSMNFSIILYFVLTIGLYIGLFYKLKTQKY